MPSGHKTEKGFNMKKVLKGGVIVILLVWAIFATISCVAAVICISELDAEIDALREGYAMYEALAEPNITETEAVSTPAPTLTAEAQLGTKSNPFVLTSDELAAEINADITAAKEKYNNKWVQITGEISDTSDGGVCYGYYIYGKRGGSGLRIVCWCDDGPYSGSVIGDMQTFLGQLREVTTVNATEIGDCKIIKD